MAQSKSDMFTTILIGNGLGMALDAGHFAINSGLQAAWDKLNTQDQDMIKSLITDSKDLNNEEQLDKHYDAIEACLALERIEQLTKKSWLREEAKNFPSNFRNFVLNTALHFFDYEHADDQIFDQFKGLYDSIRNFALNNKTHLATLNYDKLLYDQLCMDRQIMAYESGRLTDGFFVNSTGFSPSFLIEQSGHLGFYLHLHGSPLFYTDLESGMMNKTSFKDLRTDLNNQNQFREHLILCATKRKPNEIKQSPLLNFYWYFFKIALSQSDRIILFGYSGLDEHINEEISKTEKDKKIIIVEYANEHIHADRSTYWSNKLNLDNKYFNEENLLLLPSILTYRFPTNKVT